MAFPILGVLGVAIKPLAELAKGWLEKRRAAQDSQLRINEAKTNATIKRLETSQQGDIAWENTAIQNAGWKDEWFVIILSIPAVLCFIPGMADYVYKGFDALRNCPEWYQWALLVAIASSFGYRKLADFMAFKKGD